MINSLTTRGALAVAAGAALGFAFPPYNLPWLVPISIAALTLACRGRHIREGAMLGLLGGLAFFLVLLRWLTVIGFDAWILVSILEAVFWMLLGAGLAVVARLRAWPLWAATFWVLAEALRSTIPFGGLPWGQLAFAAVDTPMLPLASVGGTALVSFVIALIGSLLAFAVVETTSRRAWRPGAAIAGVAALAVVPVTLPGAPAPSGSLRAAVIQGNVPQLGLDFLGQRQAVLNNHVEATQRLADDVAAGKVDQPDIAIWPENASDINPFADPAAYDAINSAVQDLGAPVLVGALVETPDGSGIENSGIVWDPHAGPLARYVKRHPVPFGEYIPFRPLLMSLGIERLDRIPRDYVPGPRPGLLDLGQVTVGDVICFEVAYDGLVRDVVDGGAEVVVVQTNNATYGRTGQPEQQFAISRFRAVEHQRSVLVAATSGISGIIARDGSVSATAPEFSQAALVADVSLSTTRSLASRLGPWPDLLLSLAAAVAMALAWRRGLGKLPRSAGEAVSSPSPRESTIMSDSGSSG